MFYDIEGLEPSHCMGGYGFLIRLHPNCRELVAASGIDQDKAEAVLSRMGRHWLDCCGYDSIFDPDNCGHLADRKLPPGPNARHSYQPNRDLRITWGEWGLEHITVPGNACGLDLDARSLHSPRGGRVLVPHNVDCWSQVQLLLIVFTWFAHTLVLHAECNYDKRKAVDQGARSEHH